MTTAAPLPRLLIGQPNLDQAVSAINEVVEFLETVPRIEVLEKPLQTIAYPITGLLTGILNPIVVMANTWVRDSETSVHADSVHWFLGTPPRGHQGAAITITDINGISAGDERRLNLVVIGRASRA